MLKQDDIILDKDKREYKILDPIGNGGMGYVLLVERLTDQKRFAVKTLSVFVEDDGNYKALLNEGKLAEGIKHKNVIRYEYFHNGEEHPSLPPYIIMELADSATLRDLIDTHISSSTFFREEDLVSFFSGLIDGMEAINKVLVHRDVKPSNILFKDSVIKISDFGISKIAGDPTRSKSFKGSGTLPFLAPEAFLNLENSIKMDIYSMGIVFYLLATLKHPYEVQTRLINEEAWKNAHLYMVPAPGQDINKSISPKIFHVIQKMIEKNPAKRFSSWGDIRSEIGSVNTLKEVLHTEVIEKMILKNIQKTNEIQRIELESAKIAKEADQKNKIILYQFSNDIVQPIINFIEEYNKVNAAPEDQIQIRETQNETHIKDKSFEIKTNSSSFRVEISIHIINDDDFITTNSRDVFGDMFIQRIEPTLNQKKVQAWGMIKEAHGRGYNLLLVESETNCYGDWCLLKNSHSALAQRHDSRPEPFPFNFNEIKTEIHHVNVMHIYNSAIIPFDPKIIIDFISEL